MKTAIALAATLALGACAGLNVSQTAEKVDTDALAAYTAISTAAAAYAQANPSGAAGATALTAKAWGYVATEHAVYKSGGVGDITALLRSPRERG